MNMHDILIAMKMCCCESGGGGESDYSTAEVTIINTLTDVDSECRLPIQESNNSGAINIVAAESTVTKTVILYKGVCEAVFYVPDAEVTGSIERDGSNFTITGDGTITIIPGGVQ